MDQTALFQAPAPPGSSAVFFRVCQFSSCQPLSCDPPTCDRISPGPGEIWPVVSTKPNGSNRSRTAIPLALVDRLSNHQDSVCEHSMDIFQSNHVSTPTNLGRDVVRNPCGHIRSSTTSVLNSKPYMFTLSFDDALPSGWCHLSSQSIIATQPHLDFELVALPQARHQPTQSGTVDLHVKRPCVVAPSYFPGIQQEMNMEESSIDQETPVPAGARFSQVLIIPLSTYTCSTPTWCLACYPSFTTELPLTIALCCFHADICLWTLEQRPSG